MPSVHFSNFPILFSGIYNFHFSNVPSIHSSNFILYFRKLKSEIVKTIKASKGIPVIMLSGKDSPQMIETAKNEGAEEFLPKPFKDDDLVDKIKKLI